MLSLISIAWLSCSRWSGWPLLPQSYLRGQPTLCGDSDSGVGLHPIVSHHPGTDGGRKVAEGHFSREGGRCHCHSHSSQSHSPASLPASHREVWPVSICQSVPVLCLFLCATLCHHHWHTTAALTGCQGCVYLGYISCQTHGQAEPLLGHSTQ